MRCFVAIDLPPPVRNHLANAVAPLRERFDVKWVHPEQMHLTLLFAGDVDDDTQAALELAVGDMTLPAAPQLSLGGFGCFPPKGVPRVLWAGLDGDIATITELHERLAATAHELGIPKDKRFTPHVTVGRLRSEFGAIALRDRARELDAELKKKPFAVTSLTLYESVLTPRGPRHEPLRRRRFD